MSNCDLKLALLPAIFAANRNYALRQSEHSHCPLPTAHCFSVTALHDINARLAPLVDRDVSQNLSSVRQICIRSINTVHLSLLTIVITSSMLRLLLASGC